MLHSNQSRYLTIVLGVLSIAFGALLGSSQTTYAASTTTYTRINNQTIKAVDCQTKAGCSTPYYYYMGLYQWNYSRVPGHHNNNIIDTVGESSLSNLGIEDGAVFNGSIPSDKVFVRVGTDACMDFITYTSTSNLSQGGWQHLYMPKTNGQCAVFSSSNNIKPLGNIDPNFRSLTTLYQDTPSTIKSTNSSKTTSWLKVTKDVDGVKAPNLNWWIQDPSSSGQYCPSVIAKSGSDFIYMRAETLNGVYPNPASQDIFYANAIKSLGQGYQTDLSQCRLWTDTSDGSDSPWFSQSRIQIANLINGTEQTIKNLTWDGNVARTYEFPGSGHGAAAAIVGAGLFDDLVGPKDAGELTKLAVANNLDIDSSSSTSNTQTQSTSTCKVEGGLGWIICPAMKLMASVTDKMYAVIASQLSVSSGLFDTSGGTYNAWKIFRDYANIAFVIAFIIIMYSQITSVGIGNYGIKKMLPKLIIAAVLVNISFFICGLMVDVFNLLGYSIYNVFGGVSQSVLSGIKESGYSNTYDNIGAIIMAVLVGGSALLLALAAGLLAPALIAVLLVFGILLLRQALIVILIVIAPLAIVAYILPNTEKLFRQWMSIFIKVLAVFPVVAVVFGGSKLASTVISTAGLHNIDSAVSDGGLSATNTAAGLIALGVMTIPLFTVPSLLKKSLEAAGSIGAKVSGLADKGVRKSMNSQSRLAKKNARAALKKSNRAARLTGQITAGSRAGRAWQRGRNRVSQISTLGGAGLIPKNLRTRGMQAGLDSINRSALSEVTEQESKDVQSAMIAMQSQEGWNEGNKISMAQREFVNAMKNNDGVKARAAQQILLNTGNKGLQALHNGFDEIGAAENYDNMMSGGAGQKVLSDLNKANVKSKDAALAGMGVVEVKSGQPVQKISNLRSNPETYSKLSDNELATQGSLEAAIRANAISSARAQAMLNPQSSTFATLSEDNRVRLRGIAGTSGGTTPTTASPIVVPSASQTREATDDFFRTRGGNG